MSMPLMGRHEGLTASLLCQWRKLKWHGDHDCGPAGEAVMSASELVAAHAEIAKLQRVLGKQTLENEPKRSRAVRH